MDLRGKHILVFGAGKSGIGAADLLSQVGACPVLYDEKEDMDVEAVRNGLLMPDKVRIVHGKLPDEIIKETELVVPSPGISPEHPLIAGLAASGIPVWGEIELAYRLSKGMLLAITGTNGKTTTTSLAGAVVAASGADTHVVGNIGTPYTGEALKTTDESVTVAEISSFQLETIHEFHPKVSAILNITEDHLNRHHTMEEYIRVKELITLNQTSDDVCVLNYEDPVLRSFGETSCPAHVVFFSSARKLEEGLYLEDGFIVIRRDGEARRLIDTSKLMLPGVHNYENVMAAAAMCIYAGIPEKVVVRAALEFKPVPHRIEYVGIKSGALWYNDSKGTNPDAAIKGIEAMVRPTFLIAGGYDKGSDYSEWIRAFGGRVKKLVLEGKTRFDIRDAALREGFPEGDIVIFDDMNEDKD
ncbi:MAG: UDP-N-acetylmuramoyl-L-alanine--D-glutamate ligase [Lachnospiraceae bacterium]|nr:UDP-N-acetylmuramoyl-L-alanine--D-glutamate ligase [Lachnospiraceae bacterium]